MVTKFFPPWWDKPAHEAVAKAGFSVGARRHRALAGEDYFSENFAIWAFA
jgi:hypothetical protein